METKFIYKKKKNTDVKLCVLCVVRGYSVCLVLQEVGHIRYKQVLLAHYPPTQKEHPARSAATRSNLQI